MAHTYTSLLVHAVFSTKDREPLLKGEVRDRLFPYLGGIMHEMGGRALTINGVDDHVHGLISIPPTASIADVMRVVKTNSSKWIHETWPTLRSFAWQTGYGAFSVSQSQADGVSDYIARQEEHHKRMTFQEEFLALLKRHGISYDERFIWQ